jgi:hypothetical protein
MIASHAILHLLGKRAQCPLTFEAARNRRLLFLRSSFAGTAFLARDRLWLLLRRVQKSGWRKIAALFVFSLLSLKTDLFATQ